MRQLLLDIAGVDRQQFATFVTGRNTELLSLLPQLAEPGPKTLDQRFVYLWGEPGSGKSHLLNAARQAAATARLLGPDSSLEQFAHDLAIGLWLLDDAHQLTPEQQVAAFALFNQVREQGGVLVSAGNAPPAGLSLREDLRTRLGWGLVYHVQGLTDEEKLSALEVAAKGRGFEPAPGLLPWLITHYRRDMASLSALLDALDRYSLETQRPVTLPLLKQLLEQGEVQDPR